MATVPILMSNETLLNKVESIIPNNMIYLCYRGSLSHNTYIPNTDPNSVDDIDLLGVFIASKDHYLGLSQHNTTIERTKELDNGILLDCVFYELRHFVKLALKNNPSVLSALWVKSDHRILSHKCFDRFLEHRSDFLSKKFLYDAFTGYARGQLKRMTHQNKQGYMGDKRKALVDKFGYDVKNASHLVRLLHMGMEVLLNGNLKVFRDHDADILIGIKTGNWELGDVKLYASDLFSRVEEIYKQSTLPDRSNRVEIEKILMAVLHNYLIDGIV